MLFGLLLTLITLLTLLGLSFGIAYACHLLWHWLTQGSDV